MITTFIIGENLFSQSTYTTQNFKIEYYTVGEDSVPSADNNNNGISDFVELTGEHLEYCWSYFVDSIEFIAPKTTLNSNLYFVKLKNFGALSTMFLDPISDQYPNNFTSMITLPPRPDGYYNPQGIPLFSLMRSVISHEFFHAIEFAYNNAFLQPLGESYSMEGSSMAVEEIISEGENYNNFKHFGTYYLTSCNDPLNSPERSSWGDGYDTGILFYFLYLRYGMMNALKTFWEEHRTTLATNAFASTVVKLRTTFQEAWQQFAYWNCFAGPRHLMSPHYPRGFEYWEPKFTIQKELTPADWDTTIAISPISLHYNLFTFGNPSQIELQATPHIPTDSSWITIIKYSNGLIKNTYAYNLIEPRSINLGYTVFDDTLIVVFSNAHLNEFAVDTVDLFIHSNPSSVNQSKDKAIDSLVLGNFPNPFNNSTRIEFAIPNASLVNINIYDAMGREVDQLINEWKPAGRYSVNFNAGQLPSGIYFYNLQSKDKIKTGKMILLK